MFVTTGIRITTSTKEMEQTRRENTEKPVQGCETISQQEKIVMIRLRSPVSRLSNVESSNYSIYSDYEN